MISHRFRFACRNLYLRVKHRRYIVGPSTPENPQLCFFMGVSNRTLIFLSLAMQGPRPVVLSGPSGAGKSTLLKKLLKDYENIFGFSVSREYPCLWGRAVEEFRATSPEPASVAVFKSQITGFCGLPVSLSVGSLRCLNKTGCLLLLVLSGKSKICLE